MRIENKEIKYSKLPIICVRIIHARLFFRINTDTCETGFRPLSVFWGLGWFCEGPEKMHDVEQYLFLCFTVSDGGRVGRFAPMVMVVERMLQIFRTGKAYQQERLHLKDISVLPGINRLKKVIRSCVIKMHSEITN
jgi:hypothetical protein